MQSFTEGWYAEGATGEDENYPQQWRENSDQTWREVQLRAEEDMTENLWVGRENSDQAWQEAQLRAEEDMIENLWVGRENSDQAWREVQLRSEHDLLENIHYEQFEYDDFIEQRENSIQSWVEQQRRAQQDFDEETQIAILFGNRMDVANILFVPSHTTVAGAYNAAQEFARSRGWLIPAIYGLYNRQQYIAGSRLLLKKDNNNLTPMPTRTLESIFHGLKKKVLLVELRAKPREQGCKFEVVTQSAIYPRLRKRILQTINLLCWQVLSEEYLEDQLNKCSGIILAETRDMLSGRIKTCGILIYKFDGGISRLKALCSDLFVVSKLMEVYEKYCAEQRIHTLWLDAVGEQFEWYKSKRYVWTGKEEDEFEMIKILDRVRYDQAVQNGEIKAFAAVHETPATVQSLTFRMALTKASVKDQTKGRSKLDSLHGACKFIMDSRLYAQLSEDDQEEAKVSAVLELITFYRSFKRDARDYNQDTEILNNPKLDGFVQFLNAVHELGRYDEFMHLIN